ncbi:Disease resistance protein L6 [Linum perenne]
MTSTEHESSILPLPSGEYEVFLSFRGPDVRQTFADCLYSCLVRSKIRTFRDEEELPKGEFIAPSLVKAITESKIYIPIFSKNYASSKWCLQELAKMVDCWKNGGGEKGQHIILPVFYFINPRDVRHLDSGSYMEAFEQHSLKHDPETVLEWKEALQEVGKMKGWHITKSHGQGAIIDEIFSEVDIHLRANYKLATDELVGIDSHMEDVVKLLNLDSASEKIIGIHGMGGLGKTTLAKAVYNKVSTQFEGCCFLENIKDTLSKKDKDGVLVLQNKIISDTLRKHSYHGNGVKDVNDGIRVIQDRVSRQKLLIVLDDIDERFKFEDILGKLENFSVDSRFIVTTRDTRVLELLQVCKLFELEEMSFDHSLKLFSKHAFGVNYPLEDYVNLSTEFVQVATGLPLYLKVIGSLLFKRDKSFWEDKLIELKQIQPTEVQERLRISYNDLAPNEKQIFLDIAFFFIGSYKEVPMHMWGDYDFHPTSAISTLVQRSLVKIDQKERYWMHDHVRDLGKAIVREEHNQSPYKRSRISYGKDAIDLLKYKEGTDYVEALEVDMEGENLVLRNEHIKELSRLRYMLLGNARLSGSFKDVLPNIRWLGLGNCDSVPSDLNLKKLVVLQLEDCPVRDDWKGWNEIKVSCKLKVIRLYRCLNLNLVPDLSNCRDLEHLDFMGCRNMRGELDISNFKNLKMLRVSDTKITKLKVITEICGAVGLWESLSELDVRGCSCLTGIRALHCMVNLEILVLIGIGLTESVPSLLSMFTKLRTLGVSGLSLQQFPDLSNLKNLRELRIVSCNKLIQVTGLDTLENLRELRIGCRQLKEVKGIEELDLLQVFEADKRLKVKYKLKRVSRYGKQLVTMERILFSVILAGHMDQLLHYDLISEIADSKDRERYFNFVLRSYIEENRGRKWCPAPNCECAVEFCMSAGDDANYDVSCLCSHSFCWNCCEDRHRPVDCETVKNWAVKNDSESENENWKKVNTKPCPKCGRAIEKNEGCMHMTCASPCFHQFCWVCLGPWLNHKSCNRYDEDNALTSLRLELNRYQHYYDRWAANENSRQIAMKDLENVRENVVSAISKIHGQGVGQVLFLMEAWEQIVECRRVLKWTYAYGFYLGSEEAEKKNFFEYLQGQAESCLDKLHDCAEKEMKKFAMEGSCIHEYVSFRMKLHELTKLCKTYFENLVGALENGLSDVQTSKRKHADSCE